MKPNGWLKRFSKCPKKDGDSPLGFVRSIRTEMQLGGNDPRQLETATAYSTGPQTTVESQMNRKATLAVVLMLAAATCFARGDAADGDKKKSSKQRLPGSAAVEWDLHLFEDSPSFEVVRRDVKGNNVTWVLENKRGLGTEVVFGWQAALFDDDGVRLATIGIVVDPGIMNLSAGERNRFTLNLPPTEKWKDVRKIVIKNGNYQ